MSRKLSPRSDALEPGGANRVLRYLKRFGTLDKSKRRKVARMVKWNDIPYNEDADPEIKGIAFDLQIEENGGDSSVTHQPYKGDVSEEG